jgi:hypothetical protein
MPKASDQRLRTRQPKATVTVRQVPAGTLRNGRRATTTATPRGAAEDTTSRFTAYGDGTLTVGQHLRNQQAWWASKGRTT